MKSRSPSRAVFTSLDLFAGAGGFSLGIESAGFTSVGSIENDPSAVLTLESNFGQRPVDFHGPKEGDIREISTRKVKAALRKAGVDELDLLVAGPPCQGFSNVGRAKLDSLKSRRGSFVRDSRNNLYKEAIRLLRAVKPRVFIFENVSGIFHMRGRNVAEDVCDEVSAAGYHVRCTLLNTAWYGVPQTRERAIIIGFRRDLGIEPVFPTKEFYAAPSRGHLTGAALDQRNWRRPEFFFDPREIKGSSSPYSAITVQQALDDLPSFTQHLDSLNNGHKYRRQRSLFTSGKYAKQPRNEYCFLMRRWNHSLHSDKVTDHFCRWTPRDFGTFKKMKPGDRYPEAIEIAQFRYQEALKKYKKRGGKRPRKCDFIPPYNLETFRDKWRKLIPSQPSWTVTAHLGKDTYSHIHYDSLQARSITIREAARLQSFPDAFLFAGGMGDAFRQIGNAVPPLFAMELGRIVRKQLARVDGRRVRTKRSWSSRWAGTHAKFSYQRAST